MILKHFSFESKMLKMETDFIKYILGSMESHHNNENSLYYELEFLLKKLKFDEEKLVKVLDSLISKRFSYEIEDEKKLIRGKFSFISAYRLIGQQIIIDLSKEIFDMFIPESLIYEVDMDNLLCLKNNKAVKLYLEVFKSKREGLGYEITLNELKDLLEIETEYTRFYDFEKYVIKDVVDDINENSYCKVSYQKVKKGRNLNNKIESIVFYMLDKKQNLLKEQTNELLELVKYRVKDLSTIYHMIRTTIKSRGYLYTKKNLEISLLQKKRDMDIIVIKALKENLACYKQEISSGKRYYLLHSEDKYYASTEVYKYFFYIELSKVGFEPYQNADFIKGIHAFHKTHTLEYENRNYKINVYFSDSGITKTRIYGPPKETNGLINYNVYKEFLNKREDA